MTTEQMRALLELVTKHLPKQTGAMLLVFDLGAGGRMNYACNAKRSDMVAALIELQTHLQAGGDPHELLAALEATAKRLRESMQ